MCYGRADPDLVGHGGDAATGPSGVGGFSILEAASLDDAVRLLDGHPHFHSPGASIEVLEFLPVPGPPS